MYNLSVQTFKIVSLIAQDLWIVQIIAFVKREVKARNGFLISASKLEILFKTNIFASSFEAQYFTIHITVWDSKFSLENVFIFVLCPEIWTIQCQIKTST